MIERQVRDYERMMRDRVRLQAYREAIERVCPGRSVCEVGVGLGPLTLMALRAGATRVYGIEGDGEVLQLATRVIRANGFDESRFIPVRGLSHQVELPERVDVLLSETVDSTGPGENTFFYTTDAGRRFLKPGGVYLPRALHAYAALANPEPFDEQQHFWNRELAEEFGLDYRLVADELRHSNQSLVIPPERIFSEWSCWLRIEFAAGDQAENPGPLLLEAQRGGVISGLAMGFELELAPGVHLCNLPTSPSTHWRQGFSPFRQPVACGQGDCLWLDVTLGQSEHPSIDVRTRHLHIRSERVLQFMAELERKRARLPPPQSPG